MTTSSKPHFVPQALDASEHWHGSQSAASCGSSRLTEARESGAEILLLDEPTRGPWMKPAWRGCEAGLQNGRGCLVAASHDRRLLEDFRHFFVASESGCRYFSGTLAELDAELEREQRGTQERYVRNLNRLAAHEEHAAHVARRKARKKRYGRCSELDRATPRIRLNQKRGQAQVSHGRSAKSA